MKNTGTLGGGLSALNDGVCVNDNWILGYVIEFSDGGDPEIRILHKGTEADCEKMAAALPAVAYNGNRPDPKVSLRWVPVNDA